MLKFSFVAVSVSLCLPLSSGLSFHGFCISEQVTCKLLTKTLLLSIESHRNKALGKAWKSLEGAAGKGGGEGREMGGAGGGGGRVNTSAESLSPDLAHLVQTWLFYFLHNFNLIHDYVGLPWWLRW